MSRIQMLRALVNERLTAAIEDICGVLGRTMAEYEEEVSRLKEENSRQQKLLDVILKPQIRLNRTDPQQLVVCKEEVPPEQQEWSPSLGQEEPEPPHIKEEQEELIQGLEEAEVPMLMLLPEKSEDNEEQLSQLNPTQTEENRKAEPLPSTSTEQIKIELDGEDCGVSEPASNQDPASDLEPTSDGQLLSSDCCETETEDSDDDWETREPQSSLNTLKSKKTERVKGQSLSASNKFRRSLKQSSELKPSNQIPSMVGYKVCGKSFPSLMTHVRIHPRDNGLCGTHFQREQSKSRESLELHFQSHSTCNVCSKKCNCISKPERHMQVHTRQKPFSCTVCEKGFTEKAYLKKHMRSHTGELFSCSLCGKGFVDRQMLHRHMRIHTGEKPFSCSVCSKRFSRNANLKSHMSVHTGEKPFSCSICSKSFSLKGNLKTHMTVHTEEKPFSCSVCSKRFSQMVTLKTHMSVHTGQKPFICSVCGKGVCNGVALRLHMRLHTGEKPFSCSLCSKRFSQNAHLKSHMSVHTGEKPFSCSICSKIFSQSGNLKSHMKVHSREKPYSCSDCLEGFSSQSDVKNHKCVSESSSR